MKTTVEEYVHKNRGYGVSTKNDEKRCQFSVWEQGRGAFNHQCSKKPVETIDGVGFCKTHAEEVNLRLGKLKPTKQRFVACFESGDPKLAKIDVFSETEKRINILGIEKIMGDLYLGVGLQDKNTAFMNGKEYFDDMNDAIAFLISKSQAHISRLESDLVEANKTQRGLLDSWFKK